MVGDGAADADAAALELGAELVVGTAARLDDGGAELEQAARTQGPITITAANRRRFMRERLSTHVAVVAEAQATGLRPIREAVRIPARLDGRHDLARVGIEHGDGSMESV